MHSVGRDRLTLKRPTTVGRRHPTKGRYSMLAVSLGAPELIIVLLVAILIFGGTQIPKLARSVGRAQKEFQKGLDEGIADDEDEDDAGSKKRRKA